MKTTDLRAVLEQNDILIKAADKLSQTGEISLICDDSRAAVPGSVFVCKGAGFKDEYLVSAKEKGVFCCVSEKDHSDTLPCFVVSDIRRALAVLANAFYQEAWRAFPLIGITGTKGKSTTTYYVKSICEKYYAKAGLPRLGYLSTIDTFDGAEEFESHLTTPESLELGMRFANAKKAGLSAMIMEVSSQALKYDRTYGVEFSIGCFMNFGTDHIGSTEHPDLEDYLNSKLKFFDQTKTCIINLDTEKLPEILAAADASKSITKKVFFSTSGKDGADYTASDIRKENGSIFFTLNFRGEKISDIELTMPGLFNVENALAACVICLELGIPAGELAPGLLNARAAGRMELFENKEKQIAVISDYAHNELSFDRLFDSIRQEYPGWRIEALFGCPGGKGYQRREDLPRVTAKYASFVYVTEEDPAFEDPQEISEILSSNLTKYGCPNTIILDRTKAIETAIKNAPPKTVIALLAKGRELYMHRGAEYVPIESDSALAERFIREI